MAINLTYDPSDDPMTLEADQARDAENLAVGEDLERQQGELLAGKYRDAEELERAYLELQSKFGSRDQNTDDQYDQQETEQEQDEPISDDIASFLLEASNQFQQDGQLSDEVIQVLQELDPQDIVQAFASFQQDAQSPELDASEVEALQGVVGGQEEYNALIQWAGQNLSEGEITAYDNVMSTGNPEAIYFAIQALYSKYNESVGYDGRMLQGRGALQSTDVFRSQAEVVRAMNDPRYENDPAYRQDIYDKLERSQLAF